VWSTSRSGRFTPQKESRYPLNRKLDKHQSRPRSCGEQTISPPSRDFFFFSFFVLFPHLFVLTVLAYTFCPYCTTHTTQISMPPARFEPAIPAGERPQNYALDGTTTGIGRDSKPGTSSTQPGHYVTQLSWLPEKGTSATNLTRPWGGRLHYCTNVREMSFLVKSGNRRELWVHVEAH
jgi:hypothetical protein